MVIEPKRCGHSAGECSESGVVYGDDVADQIGALFGHEGRINTFSVGQTFLCRIVVGHRIGESRDCGRLGKAVLETVSRRLWVVGSTSQDSDACMINENWSFRE